MNLLYTLGAALAFAIAAFFYGQHTANNACKAAQLAAQIAAQQQYIATERANIELANELEKTKREHATAATATSHAIAKIIDRPVYRATCLDADGLRIANDALAGHASTAP